MDWKLQTEFVNFLFGPCRGKFVDIPSINHFGVIMVYAIQTLQIPGPFHFHPVLMTGVAWAMVEAVEQHRRFTAAVCTQDKDFST